MILPPIRQEVHLDIWVPRSSVWSGRQIYGLKDVDNQLMAHFVVPQLHLYKKYTWRVLASIHSYIHHTNHMPLALLFKILTESCPGSTRGRSRRVPGLVGDITDIEGRSIFCDSKELEPAVEESNSCCYEPQKRAQSTPKFGIRGQFEM